MSVPQAAKTQVTRHIGNVQAESIVVGPSGSGSGPWLQSSVPFATADAFGASTTNRVRYQVVGKRVHWTLLISQTNAGTASTTLQLTLPIPARATNSVVGYGYLTTTGGDFIVVGRTAATTTTMFLSAVSNSAGPSLVSNAVASWQGNALWFLELSGSYEIA